MAGGFYRPLQRAKLEKLDRPVRQQQAQDQLPAQKGDQQDQQAAQEAEQQARSERWAYRGAQGPAPREPSWPGENPPSQPTEAQPPIEVQASPPFKPEEVFQMPQSPWVPEEKPSSGLAWPGQGTSLPMNLDPMTNAAPVQDLFRPKSISSGELPRNEPEPRQAYNPQKVFELSPASRSADECCAQRLPNG
jgi:hypothetical protein